MKQQITTVPIDLEMSKDSYEKLAAARKTQDNSALTSAALTAICRTLIDAFANGGIMVRPDNVKRIEEACDCKLATDAQIVQVVQKANNRDEGMYATVVKIDPALHQAIKEHADTVGWSIEDVINDMGHRMIRDGLAFYVSNQSWEPVIYMTERDGQYFEKLLGKKHYSGSDLIKLLEAKQEVAA